MIDRLRGRLLHAFVQSSQTIEAVTAANIALWSVAHSPYFNGNFSRSAMVDHETWVECVLDKRTLSPVGDNDVDFIWLC